MKRSWLYSSLQLLLLTIGKMDRQIISMIYLTVLKLYPKNVGNLWRLLYDKRLNSMSRSYFDNVLSRTITGFQHCWVNFNWDSAISSLSMFLVAKAMVISICQPDWAFSGPQGANCLHFVPLYWSLYQQLCGPFSSI